MSAAASSEATETTASSSFDDGSTDDTNNTNTNDINNSIKWTTKNHRLLSKEQVHKVDRVFHKILWLDMFETSMLNDYVNYRLGILLTPKQNAQLERQLEAFDRGMVGLGGGGGVPSDSDAEPEEEQQQDAGPKAVDVKLVSFDAKSKIKLIKEVRASTPGLGLKEAKELVEGAPCLLGRDLKLDDAEAFRTRLQEAVGGGDEKIQVEFVSK